MPTVLWRAERAWSAMPHPGTIAHAGVTHAVAAVERMAKVTPTRHEIRERVAFLTGDTVRAFMHKSLRTLGWNYDLSISG